MTRRTWRCDSQDDAGGSGGRDARGSARVFSLALGLVTSGAWDGRIFLETLTSDLDRVMVTRRVHCGE